MLDELSFQTGSAGDPGCAPCSRLQSCEWVGGGGGGGPNKLNETERVLGVEEGRTAGRLGAQPGLRVLGWWRLQAGMSLFFPSFFSLSFSVFSC